MYRSAAGMILIFKYLSKMLNINYIKCQKSLHIGLIFVFCKFVCCLTVRAFPYLVVCSSTC